MKKRLFLFAGYDEDNIVDATLLWYLKALSKFGDIVFVMDTDLPESELVKITEIPNVLYATATRHGEYDFGSYKRGYIWARDNKILKKYDWVYLVNDSVLGPLFDLAGVLSTLESSGADFTGIYGYANSCLSLHIQSWFLGLGADVACSDVFSDFIESVCAQTCKQKIVFGYEIRLSQLLLQNGYKKAQYFYDVSDDESCIMYAKPLIVLNKGVPFIKKQALHNLPTLDLILPYTTPEFATMIADYCNRPSNIKKSAYQAYRKVYTLSILSLPIFSIYKRYQWDSRDWSYKLNLFGKIPFLKIISNKGE